MKHDRRTQRDAKVLPALIECHSLVRPQSQFSPPKSAVMLCEKIKCHRDVQTPRGDLRQAHDHSVLTSACFGQYLRPCAIAALHVGISRQVRK